MTVWVRLSPGQGTTLVNMARRNGILADEQARMLVVAGLDTYQPESG